MAQKGRKKKEEARLRQEQSRQAKEQKAMAAWQEIVDEAHAEALAEDPIRMSDARIRETQKLHEYIAQQKKLYDTQVMIDNTYGPIFDSAPPNMDYIHEIALKENALFDEANLAAQKDANIDKIIDDVLSENSPQEAQTVLNAKVRAGDMPLEDSKIAKAKITADINARQKKLNVPLNRASQSYRIAPDSAINRSSHMNLASPVGPIKLNPNSELFPQMERKFKRVSSNVVAGAVDEGTENLAKSHLKKALSGRNLNALLNVGMTITDYNEARNAGDSVLKAGLKAGAQFVAGEALGAWMLPVTLAKAAPSIAISGVEAAQSVTRKMNSVSRTQVFGESYFQDTQQLATMRQAGMEMAKMSQYNLQQSIMGNEAQYMHRL